MEFRGRQAFTEEDTRIETELLIKYILQVILEFCSYFGRGNKTGETSTSREIMQLCLHILCLKCILNIYV